MYSALSYLNSLTAARISLKQTIKYLSKSANRFIKKLRLRKITEQLNAINNNVEPCTAL